MSEPGRIARGAPLRRVHGELALLGACTAVARLDFEHEEGKAWLRNARTIASQLPPGAVMVEPLPCQSLIDALAAFEVAIENAGRMPTGERDWIGVERAQGALREAVTNAMASLYHRALPVWTRGEVPPWEGYVPPEPEEEPESEGVG